MIEHDDYPAPFKEVPSEESNAKFKARVLICVLVGVVVATLFYVASHVTITNVPKSFEAAQQIVATAVNHPVQTGWKLPDDICRVKGVPQVLGVHEPHFGGQFLTYIDKDGNIVSQEYGGGFGSPKRYVWSGGYCPDQER